MQYWYSHLPCAAGVHDGENKMNNWWKYIYDFESYDVDGLPPGLPRRGPGGHYYKFVEAPGVTWQQALDAAALETWEGYVGHLVTITSAEEEAFVVDLSRGRESWLAGSDAQQEGTWRWMAGPEAGEIFYADGAPTGYSGFDQGQPDGVGDENHLHMIFAQFWNDVNENYPNNRGYVVEFSVAAGDYDHDGDRDGTDFLVWQRTVGSEWDLDADGDGNGSVDAGDLTTWRGHFGTSALAGALDNRAPEPVLLVLAALGVMGLQPRSEIRRRSRAAG